MFVITKKRKTILLRAVGGEAVHLTVTIVRLSCLRIILFQECFFCLISTSSLVLWGGRVWSRCFVSNMTVFVRNKFWEAIHKVLIERNFLFFPPVVISWVQTEIIQLFVCVWQKSSLSFLFDKVKNIVHRER